MQHSLSFSCVSACTKQLLRQKWRSEFIYRSIYNSLLYFHLILAFKTRYSELSVWELFKIANSVWRLWLTEIDRGYVGSLCGGQLRLAQPFPNLNIKLLYNCRSMVISVLVSKGASYAYKCIFTRLCLSPDIVLAIAAKVLKEVSSVRAYVW